MSETTIDTRTLPQQIEARLIELIADGVLLPGQPLRLSSLCEEYGFTQTPLREALRFLDSQGIVDYLPNRGYRVHEMGEDELKDILEVREALEGLAAHLMATRATKEQLAQLHSLATECDEMTQKTDANAIKKEMEFHGLIAEWCGNEMISNMLLGPRLLLRALLKASGLQGMGESGEHGHKALVEAIASGDPTQAEAAAKAHIRQGEEETLQALKNSISDRGAEQDTAEY